MVAALITMSLEKEKERCHPPALVFKNGVKQKPKSKFWPLKIWWWPRKTGTWNGNVFSIISCGIDWFVNRTATI